jgi:hypothetical protein
MSNKIKKQANQALRTLDEDERLRRERAVLRLVLLVEAAGTVTRMQQMGLFNNDLEALSLMSRLAPPSRGGVRPDAESEEDWRKLVEEGIKEFSIDFLVQARRQMDQRSAL